jgi:hypothetical protein
VSWPFEESALFYVRERHLDWLRCEVFEFAADRERYDYYYLLGADQPFGFKADPLYLNRHREQVVRAFPASRSFLLAAR